MAFRSSAIASSSSGGTITATPAGVAAHDYLGATYLCDTNTGSLNVPAGWTNDQTNQWASGGPDGGRQFYAFKGDASGTDGFGFSDTAGTASNALITAAWSGRDNSTPHSTARVKTLDTNSNTTPVSATITGITASAGDDIAVFMGTDQTAADGRWTYSTITDYTERQDGVATNWVSGIALDTRDNVSAGATGNFSTTITRGSGTGNTGYAAVVVAIKAAAGGVTGTVNVTEANDTSSASGTLTISGTVSVTEAADTSAASGWAQVTGTVAVTEADDIGAVSGAETFTGTISVTEADDTLSATGTVGDGVNGTVNVTEADDTAAAVGALTISGTGSVIEEADVSTAQGWAQVTGTIAITESSDTLVATGSVVNLTSWRVINAIELDSGRVLNLWVDTSQLQ